MTASYFASWKNVDKNPQLEGPIKVNQEFSLSISGSFFSGLDPNIYSGFKPEIHFLYQFCLFFFSAIASFSQLFISRIMGFKTQVFNLQVLTQTEFKNPKKSHCEPEKRAFSGLL